MIPTHKLGTQYMLENFSDFYLPLIKVLDELPSRTGSRSYVIKTIETQYGDQISPSLFGHNSSRRIKWIYNVEMCRVFLLRKNFIDAPSTGIWRLTEKGHIWLLEHPNATHLSENRDQIIHSRFPNFLSESKARQSPVKPKPQSADHAKSRILDREIENIQYYLAGQNSLQPSNEKLCDWVHFCYIFEMYAEGKELFSLVSENNVNHWYFERTKRIVKACEQKLKLA